MTMKIIRRTRRTSTNGVTFISETVIEDALEKDISLHLTEECSGRALHS
jgi:hypothetical protein